MEYKLFRYIEDRGQAVYSINYKTELNTRLHPKHEVVKGELRKTTYFAEASMNSDQQLEYNDPVLEVSFVWNRNPLGFCYRRDMIIRYYTEEGTLGDESKSTQKWYSNDEAISEGKRRRQNIVDGITMPIMGLMMATMSESDHIVIGLGRDFLKSHQASFTAYVQDSNLQIIADIVADTTGWLSNPINAELTTIRQVILSSLSL